MKDNRKGKGNIEEIDQLIKDTLSKEEAAFYDSLDEQNVFEMLFGLFKGKKRLVSNCGQFNGFRFFRIVCLLLNPIFQRRVYEGINEMGIWKLGFYPKCKHA